jgi:CheY-like chemotaxis protein
VAKILVADDNSNIQKMVGLALKDHGIEVVAVGNGEAAVRKIADIRPDLVLADVFMPVRNGYEVCKFVKDDKSLAHIPVILLVGAFDPLDEQEAQRAGADGVLKKPFVPPDPLISMVKSALVRAGVAHAGFNPKPTAEPAPAPEVAAAPRISLPTLAAQPAPFEVPAEAESFVDDVPPRPAAVKIESGEQPVAFGSLLDTGTSTDEQPPEVTTAPVTMERDWRSSKPEEEDEEEEDTSAKGSWRRGTGDEQAAEEEPVSSRDFRSRRHETWTPTREKEDLAAAAESPERVTAAVAEIGQDRQPPAPFSGDAWAAAMQSESESKTAVAQAEKPEAPAAQLDSFVEHAPAPAIAQDTSVPAHESTPEVSPSVLESDRAVVEALTSEKTTSWFSTPPNPWEAEAQKASQLASTWDATVITPVSDTAMRGDVSIEPTSAPDEIEVVSGNTVLSEMPGETVETVREEAAQAVQQAEQAAEQASTSVNKGEAVHDAAAHFDMDAIVAKVLARLSPGLLNDATRELLRPVVEAVIREELNAKKF